MSVNHCTFKVFKESHPEITSFVTRAYDDIPGFAKSGDSLYGNCDNLMVRLWVNTGNDVMMVHLSK